MSIPILQSCKKRKRRPKIFSFHTFGNPGCPFVPTSVFRDNIRLFLQEGTMPEDYCVDGMPIWCALLMHEKKSFVFPFYVIQENVEESDSSFCEHCRLAGWSSHFMSKKRYRMIIPMDSSWNKPLEPDSLDLPSHLLHGLIHGNGFGHLISINGIEGGSRYLYGRELMDLWDRVCSTLCVRKISVEDSSKKRGMDLRLLYGVAYGHSWFGRWGYKFLRASFGVKENKYRKAIELLSSLELDKIVQEFSHRNQSTEIKKIVKYHRDMSESALITLRDLLRFILIVKSRAALRTKPTTGCLSPDSKPMNRYVVLHKKSLVKSKPVRYRTFNAAMSEMDTRWPTRRLEQAAEVIVNALLEKRVDGSGHYGMTRQDVRDAARAHIGDTGLLDNVLKSLNNVIVGDFVVCRAVNPLTRILEYTVHEVGTRRPDISETQEAAAVQDRSSLDLTAAPDAYEDLAYIYKNVILQYPESPDGPVTAAVKVVLYSKHFAKEWPFRDEEEQILNFICSLLPRELMSDNLQNSIVKFQPGEYVSVPLHSTIRDLKLKAQSAFRDTYCIFEKLVVEEIKSMEEVDDEEVLFGLIESGAEVVVKGSGVDMDTKFKYEGGAQNWKVRCECGAQDDDGERMVACDICEVWQHTRCCGIEDRESVPPLFVCSGCCNAVVGPNNRQHEEIYHYEQPEISSEFEHFGSLLLPPDLEYLNEMDLPF